MSKKEHKNYTDFAETRLPWHLAKIDAGEMDFRVPEVIGMQDTVLTSSNYYDLNINDREEFTDLLLEWVTKEKKTLHNIKNR